MNTAFAALTEFPRILIGPLFNPGVLGCYLGHPRIRTFMSTPGGVAQPPYDRCYDILTVTAADLLAPWPDGWEPDILIWWDGVYQAIPPGLDALPIPTALIPGDWNLMLSTLWPYLSAFDWVLADRALLQLMEQGGLTHGVFWPGFSFEPAKHRRLPEQEKRYDITFVGNLNHHIQRQRGFLLERLCQLSDRYRLKLACGVYGEDYVQLLNQSRIAFNYTIAQVMNMRAYEAPACGCLLFIEDHNLEIRDFLEDGVSCVLYNADNLEQKLAWYLSHEEERAAIAERGWQQIQAWSYEKQFEKLLLLLPELCAREPGRRLNQLSAPDKQWLQNRQIFRSSTPQAQQRALLEMTTASERSPVWSARLAALLISDLHTGKSYAPIVLEPQADLSIRLESALSYLHFALQAEPHNPVWHYNLGWCLELMARPAAAVVAYQQVLHLLERPVLPHWHTSMAVLPERYSHFEVEWEARYRLMLGPEPDLKPLSRLLRWQSCLRLAVVDTPEQTHRWLMRAVQAEPTLGDAPLLLARSWEHFGILPKALAALQVAVRNEPFLIEAWQQQIRLLPLAARTAEALALIRWRTPCLQTYPTFDNYLPEFKRWQTLLEALVLVEQPATPARLQALIPLLRTLCTPESVVDFMRFYLFLQFRLDKPWNWLFINLELDWAVTTPEPVPDLFPALNRFTGQYPALRVHSGPAAPPDVWQRRADTGQPLPGELNHHNLPCLFPEPRAELFEIEGLERFNLLILLSDPLSVPEIAWLTTLRDWGEGIPGFSLLLWFRQGDTLSPPTLVALERLFATTALSVTQLTELADFERQNVLMQQVQSVGGVFQHDWEWYYRWAQAWGIPLWLGGAVPEAWGTARCETADAFSRRFEAYATEQADLRAQSRPLAAEQHQRFLTAWQMRLDWIEVQMQAEFAAQTSSA